MDRDGRDLEHAHEQTTIAGNHGSVGYKASVSQRRPAVLALAAVLCTGGATGAARALAPTDSAKTRWVIRDLGTLPQLERAPVAINDATQIVGLAHDPVGSYELAFLWQNGKLTTFGAFGGQPSTARAINNRGQALVQTQPPTDKRGDAYLWQKGKLTRLPPFNPNVPATFAAALNDHGTIAGTSLLGIGRQRPFVWQNGRITALPTPGGKTTAPITSASAINNRGQIVGTNSADVVMWTREGGR
jgi:uncharacterized membrane protein